MNRNQSSPENKSVYFDMQADFGITKHMGGRKATRELIELCHIQKSQRILEVGCGIGATACYLAEDAGCQVIGVDLSAEMVARSKERARRHGLEARVEFRVADAQNLPFEEGVFDAVIDESVTAFVPEKPKALSEYRRVAKPGGYIGLNEVTWTKTPDPDMAKYMSLIMANADFLPPKGWKELLEGCGLREIEVRNYPFNARSQYLEELRQLDFGEYLRAWRRFFTQSFTNPVYRQFVKELASAPRNIFKFMSSIGYGLYVGKK